jgi:hypothetical protein
VFWVVTPSVLLVGRYQLSERNTASIFRVELKIRALYFSETLVSIYRSHGVSTQKTNVDIHPPRTYSLSTFCAVRPFLLSFVYISTSPATIRVCRRLEEKKLLIPVRQESAFSTPWDTSTLTYRFTVSK